MQLTYKGLSGSPGPTKCFTIQVKTSWDRHQKGEIITSGPRVSLRMGAHVPLAVGAVHLQPSTFTSRPWDVDVTFALRDDEIRWVEDRTGSADLDFAVAFDWTLLTGEVTTTSVQGPDGVQRVEMREPHFIRAGASGRCRVPRSDWNAALESAGWGQRRWFEVPIVPLAQHGRLFESLKHLEEAERALKSALWPAVLTECRAAVEAAAKVEGNGVKAGLASLLEQALPGDPAAAHRESLDGLFGAFRNHANLLARHAEGRFHTRATREEAEFVYISTVGLFSMLGRLGEG